MKGPEPKTLLPPISMEVLRSEASTSIQELAGRFIAEVGRPIGWFNTRFGQSFAVLTCCRMLQTWSTGTVESKLSSVKWAEQCLDPVWCGLIREAWAERRGVRYGEKVRQPADAILINETAKFLAYAVSLAASHEPA
jgi:hypothetical protein